MSKAAPYVAVAVIIALNALLAYALIPYSIELFGMPAIAVCIAVAFGVQWLIFVPAYISGSEKFFDLTGSVTYLLVGLLAMASRDAVDLRSLLIATCVSVWAVRLGLFLARRVRAEGKDGRFDSIKTDFGLFLMTWTLQGIWVAFCYAPGLAAMTSAKAVSADVFLFLGVLLWLLGFTIEVVADRQKSAFREDPANQGQFISTGLWARSRHPNYFGEITLWLGVTLMALPVLEGWQLITLASPVFTWLLLTRITGVRMLAERGRARWGADPRYQSYTENTPMLFPRLVLRD